MEPRFPKPAQAALAAPPSETRDHSRVSSCIVCHGMAIPWIGHMGPIGWPMLTVEVMGGSWYICTILRPDSLHIHLQIICKSFWLSTESWYIPFDFTVYILYPLWLQDARASGVWSHFFLKASRSNTLSFASDEGCHVGTRVGSPWTRLCHEAQVCHAELCAPGFWRSNGLEQGRKRPENILELVEIKHLHRRQLKRRRSLLYTSSAGRVHLFFLWAIY